MSWVWRGRDTGLIHLPIFPSWSGIYERKLRTNRHMPGLINLDVFWHTYISLFVHTQTFRGILHSFIHEAPDHWACSSWNICDHHRLFSTVFSRVNSYYFTYWTNYKQLSDYGCYSCVDNMKTVCCEGCLTPTCTQRDFTNLKEDIYRLSDELQKKDTVPSNYIDMAASESKGPSTRTRVFLKPCVSLHGLAFHPHVTAVVGSWNRSFL